eukprot:m.107592 g.107592  ORF g.107592 m.107592 type:complete len:147 (-) comp9226_c0_seq2:87-527(-)
MARGQNQISKLPPLKAHGSVFFRVLLAWMDAAALRCVRRASRHSQAASGLWCPSQCQKPCAIQHKPICHRRVQGTRLDVFSALNVPMPQDGQTPLHTAARQSLTNVVQLLLNNGGDPQCSDEQGRKPVDLAATSAIREAMTRRVCD